MDLFLINFKKEKNNAENKKLQSEISKILSEKLLDIFYKTNTTLEHNIDGSPYFKNSDINISISHTENIIALLFSKNKSGVDIEYMKERNFKKVLKRYSINSNTGKTEFYQLWTDFEARYKGLDVKTKSFIYKNSVCSYCITGEEINVFEITLKDNNFKDINEIKKCTAIKEIDDLKNRIKFVKNR